MELRRTEPFGEQKRISNVIVITVNYYAFSSVDMLLPHEFFKT